MNSRKYLIINCAEGWNAAIVELNDEQLKTVLTVCRALNKGYQYDESFGEGAYIKLYPISSVKELLDKNEVAEDIYYSLSILYNGDFIKIKYNPYEMENLL